MKFDERVSYSRRVTVNFVCTGGDLTLGSRRQRGKTERKREVEKWKTKERQKSRGERGHKGTKWERKKGRARERANETRTVYLATGGTYRSICAQPLNTQTAYVGIHRFQFLLLCLFFLRARQRQRRLWRRRSRREGGGWWLPVDCTLRTALCAYTGSLICASTSG